jgi:hypothetical protein
VQRWEKDGVEDRRKDNNKEPVNKLSEIERARVLKTVNSKEFKDLPPSQIVPMLADRGQYIASESTFYRVLRLDFQA